MIALSRLTATGEALTVARQNYVEFRSVATRPANVNGLGMTPEEADAELDTMEGLFLPLSTRMRFMPLGVTSAAAPPSPASRFTTRASPPSARFTACLSY